MQRSKNATDTPKVTETTQSTPLSTYQPLHPPGELPLFDHFVGESCALSRDSDTWCRVGNSHGFRKMPFPKGVIHVTPAMPFRYFLTATGDVFRFGKYLPERPGGKSIDCESPCRVAELRDIIDLQHQNQTYYALRKSGELLVWTEGEERDEEDFGVGYHLPAAERFSGEKFSKVFAGVGDLCGNLMDGRFACSAEKDFSHQFAPPQIQKPVSAGYLGSAACFYLENEGVHCYSDVLSVVRPPEVAPSECLRGHYFFDLNSKKLVTAPNILLDSKGRLLHWTDSFAWSRDLEAPLTPKLTHLEEYGAVLDFSGELCVINADHRLRCNWGGDKPGEPSLLEPCALKPGQTTCEARP